MDRCAALGPANVETPGASFSSLCRHLCQCLAERRPRALGVQGFPRSQRLGQFRYRHALLAALGLYGVGHVTIMVLLHPDEYVYYNGFIGGVKGAEQLFKTDYWANSYAEAVKGLTNYLETEYGAEFEDHDFTVAVCGPPISANYFFPDNLVYTNDRANADFFIAFTKDNCDKALPGQEIYRVERMGALLSLVLDRRAYVHGPGALPPVKPADSPTN